MLQKTNPQEILSCMPALETPRLRLRKMTPSDSGDMYAYARREDVTKYLLWDPHPNLAYTKAYLDAGSKTICRRAFF